MLCHDVPARIRDAQTKAGPNGMSLGRRLLSLVDGALLGWTLRRARIVFANSRYVAGWIERDMGVDPSRIRFAPCAPGADFRELSSRVDRKEVKGRLGTPDGYVLTNFGGRHARGLPGRCRGLPALG